MQREAQQLRDRRRAREAIALYERLIAVAPERVSAHAELGFCWLDLRDYPKALKHFEDALDRDRSYGKALYGAALALLELGRLEEASSYAQRQAGLDLENRARGLYVLGLIDYARGAWREAATNLEESRRIKPERPRRDGKPAVGDLRHRYVLAQCYRELGEQERALEHLRWLGGPSRRPSRALQLELADLYLEIKREDDAQRCYEAVLERSPNDRQAQLGIGRVHLARHDYERAIEAFSRVLSVASDDLDALNGLAEAYKGQGKLDKALGYLDQIRSRYRMPQVQLERRLRALELERQRRDAELLRMRNIASLNLMATGIAHELRQPLSVIRLAAQNARKDLARGQFQHLDEDLNDIDTNVDRIDKVVSVLRDVSSQEGAMDEEVDPAEVLDAALALFRTQLAHRDIALEVTLDGHRVLGQRVALQQVFVNLISNARDALADTPEKRIKIWAVSGPTDVWVYFRNTGCGMPPAVRDQAFDPFFTTKPDGGTGLGLYIAFNLVNRMHGALRIKETAPGEGTTFELRLRRAPGDALHE